LHRICYLNVAHYEARIMCTTSAWDVRGMLLRQHVTHMWRVCRPFVYCRCRALLERRKCAGPWVTFGQYCMLFSPLCYPRDNMPITHMSVARIFFMDCGVKVAKYHFLGNLC
jgi:hypothetical protein